MKDKLIVIETLQNLIDREIANFFMFSKNEIVVWLEDNTKVKITTTNSVKKHELKIDKNLNIKEGEYVLNHDYGYNREPERKNLRKLKLRNLDDLKTYIKQFIEDKFCASFINWIVVFNNSKLKTKILLEIIK